VSRFLELSTYKQNIIIAIIANSNIVKAIYNTDSNFIDQSLPSGFDANNLVYQQVFPYRFIPEISEEAKNYLTMSFTNYKKLGNQYKAGYMYFYVLCHKSLVQTDYGCLRYDYILNELDEMFSEERGYGLGKLEFNSMDDISFGDDYVGVSLSYRIVDFK